MYAHEPYTKKEGGIKLLLYLLHLMGHNLRKKSWTINDQYHFYVKKDIAKGLLFGCSLAMAGGDLCF
jgi:hypothetical protein